MPKRTRKKVQKMYENEKENITFQIQLLREEYKKALELHHFMKAKELDEKIRLLKTKRNETGKQTTVVVNNNNLEKEKAFLRSYALRFQNEFSQRLITIRTKYQIRYQTILQKQQEEAKKLATDFAKNIELESIRRVPTHLTLIKESELRAKISHQYEIADELIKKAEEVKNETCQQRQNDIHLQFQNQQDYLLKQQQQETDQHLAKLNEEIEMLYVEYGREMAKLKRALISQSIKFNKPISDEEADEFFKQYTLVDEEGEANFVESKSTTPSTVRSSSMKKQKSQTNSSKVIPRATGKSSRTPSKTARNNRIGLQSPAKSPVYSRTPFK